MQVRKRRWKRKRVRRKAPFLCAVILFSLAALAAAGKYDPATLSQKLELEAAAEAAGGHGTLEYGASGLGLNLFEEGRLPGLGLLGGEYFPPAVVLGDSTLTETYAEDVTPAAVPEPASFLLIGSGLIGLAGLRRLKK